MTINQNLHHHLLRTARCGRPHSLSTPFHTATMPRKPQDTTDDSGRRSRSPRPDVSAPVWHLRSSSSSNTTSARRPDDSARTTGQRSRDSRPSTRFDDARARTDGLGRPSRAPRTEGFSTRKTRQAAAPAPAPTTTTTSSWDQHLAPNWERRFAAPPPPPITFSPFGSFQQTRPLHQTSTQTLDHTAPTPFHQTPQNDRYPLAIKYKPSGPPKPHRKKLFRAAMRSSAGLPPLPADPRGNPNGPGAQAIVPPVPTKAYLRISQEPSTRLPAPARLLVILDLNGTLLCRRSKSASGSAEPIPRPGLAEFLAHVFLHFRVMIWTSARPENAERMVKAVFSAKQRSQLLAVWGRDTLGLTKAQYNAKVQVYKKLGRVFIANYALKDPETGEGFDQTNTVLFDDSTEKAVGEPYNLVKVPEFFATPREVLEDRTLGECIKYLEQVKWEANVSAFMRLHPFEYDPAKMTETVEDGKN